MKKFIPILIIISFVSWFFFDSDKEVKRQMLEKKWFKDNNTYILICRGWPKEGLNGKARINSAKEAALMNAQFTAKGLFTQPVDVVKNGTIWKFIIYDDYATVEYIIKYKGLRKYYTGTD